MKVIADVAPEIKLIGPESRRVRVRPTSRLNLEVQANDPDFGLSQIDIEIRRAGIVVRRETLLKSEGTIGQQIKRLPINMADFRIAEGSTLEVRATAQDNRHDPVSERLAPNVKESELLTLEVVGADQEPDPAAEQMAASDEQNDAVPVPKRTLIQVTNRRRRIRMPEIQANETLRIEMHPQTIPTILPSQIPIANRPIRQDRMHSPTRRSQRQSFSRRATRRSRKRTSPHKENSGNQAGNQAVI